MGKYTASFARNEKKYVVTKNQRDAFEKAIEPYTHGDMYGKHTICNIYFDNQHNESIIKSLNKPLYKEKVRMRSYNIPTQDTPVYMEVKKKFSGVVYKRRVALGLDEANAYAFKNVKPQTMSQTFEEIAYSREMMNLDPVIYIAYDRIAYAANENEAIRITLDENIRWRDDDLDMQLGDHGTCIDEDLSVLEIKVDYAMPLWLVKIMDALNIFPSSYSKYGRCYSEAYQISEG